jgi:hypothetical protein
MVEAVCTLFDGDYQIGVGALANSLYRAGYRGVLWAGYRGELPSWAQDGEGANSDGFSVRFVELAGGGAIAWRKPELMLRVLDELEPDATQVLFFDADSLAIAPWQFFTEWSRDAVAAVLDAWYPRVPPHHPWRDAWRALVQDAGLVVRKLTDYHQSAFVGVPRHRREVLDRWQQLIEYLLRREPVRRQQFQQGSRFSDPFFGTDQDLLAAALMATDAPIATLGPEAYGFTGFACVMLHPQGMKPWQRKGWARILESLPPDLYERAFWRHLDHPIEVMPPARRRVGAFRCRCAAAIGRVYRTGQG